MNVTKDHKQLFNSADFPPMIGELVAPIFGSHNESEHHPFSANRNSHKSSVSCRNHSFKHFTDNQAKILLSFASTLNPYHQVPSVKHLVKSFEWYKRTLTQAPVILFLAQKQELMSENSLYSINPSFETLRNGIARLASEYSEPGAHRHSYHLADLTTSDIFRLALSSISKSHGAPSLDGDKLYEQILKRQIPKVLDCQHEELPISSLGSLLQQYPVTYFNEKFSKVNEPKEAHELFLSSVAYQDIYMLSIEYPVIEETHRELLKFIESQSDFEVFAVRLTSEFPFVESTSSGEVEDATRNINATYDDLMKWVHIRHKKDRELSGPSELMRAFGNWGLVEVSEAAPDCFYLLK